MKKSIYIFIAAVIIFIGSCVKSETESSLYLHTHGYIMTLRATMPADNPSTRIALENIPESLNLSAKWKAGDRVKLFFVQGDVKAESDETTVFNISENGKQCSFNIPVPAEIDRNAPFNLYAFSGIPGQGVRLIDGNILADITPVKNVRLQDFSAPVWSESKNITSFSADIELIFKHLGAYEVIHLRNIDNINKEITNCYLIPEDTEIPLWYHTKNENMTPFFNPEDSEITQQASTATQSSNSLTIAGESTNTIISWYVPNGGNIPELSMKINDLLSANIKVEKSHAMQPGNAYHIYSVWNGFIFSMTDDDFNECQSVEPPKNFQIISESSYKYSSDEDIEILFNLSNNNDYKNIKIDWIDHNYVNSFTLEFWGSGSDNMAYASSHENLNGKHIKDRLSEGNRTVYYGKLKMTLISTGPYKSVTGITIYDGSKTYHFNVFCNKIVYNRDDEQNSLLMDEHEPDGETSTYEITESGLDLYNIYNEITPGNKIHERIDLGHLRNDDPKWVGDFFDDPRLAAT